MSNLTQSARGVQEAAANLGEKTKDLAANTADKAKDLAANTADQAKNLGKSAVNMADTATSRVGSGVESMADKLRGSAPREGIVHDAASKVADTLERGGRYLQEEGLSGMTDDLTNVIKRNPIPALLVGIGIGYLIAHALRR
jgi:F0F1-type ATP synthase assembly protein I